TAADVPEDRKGAKGYKDVDASIEGAFNEYKKLSNDAPLDILVHSVAFSPEIQNGHLDVSRQAYLTAQSVSAYSLVALTRAALPLMQGRDASIVGLTYLASQRVTPGYGGGMASAKAALEQDARALSWFAGEHGVRVNLVSPGPYASRAARSIGDMQQMVEEVRTRSPLRQAIDAQDVADATTFLCSPFAQRITGTCLYVDAGFNVMNAV
ncbi:MAG: SDR family oxidoreductase, partial [Myxococcota bacterium]